MGTVNSGAVYTEVKIIIFVSILGNTPGIDFCKKLPYNLSESYESEYFHFVPNWHEVVP